MAVLDFPSSPTTGQQYAAPNGVTYQWDGAAWVTTGGPANVWTDTGTALTPTDATKNVSIPATATNNALVAGSRTIKGRLVTYTAGNISYLTENMALSATPAWVRDDAAKPAWAVALDVDADQATVGHLNVAGTFTTPFFLDASGNLQIAGSNATKATGTTWINPSDPRLKQDIAPYAAGLAHICQLAPITYQLKAQPDGPLCYGFDAEKVRDVFPECVSTTKMKLDPADEAETEDVLVFDMHPILIAIVNALKEVETRLAALEAR